MSMENDPPEKKPPELGEFELPELPEIQLPEIPLPEIPELDLDSLTSDSLMSDSGKRQDAQDKQESDDSYSEFGSAGSGPVSFEDMKKMAPEGKGMQVKGMQVPTINVPEFTFVVPQGAQVADTGLAPVDKPMSRPDGTTAFEIEHHTAVSQPAPENKKKHSKNRRKKKSKSRSPSQNQDSFPAAAPQVPLGENVIDFSSTPRRASGARQKPVVNIKEGRLEKNGSYSPIEPDLQASLSKLHDFLQREFTTVDRAQILGRIRKAAKNNEDTGEMLKLLVTPVLKLGKKRYSVINDLLKIKDVFPNFTKEVFLAFMVSLLGD